MIHILQVVGGLDRGGVETLFLNIYKNIDKKRFQFVFLCYGNDPFDYEEEVLKLGAKIVRLPQPKNPFTHIKQVEEVIRKENISIVHSHTYYNSAFIMMAAKRCGVKLRITHSHNTKDNKPQNWKRKMYAYICKKLIRFYTTDFVACGQEAGEALFGKKKSFKIVHNGIAIDAFRWNEKVRREYREQFQVPEDQIVIGHVGRFQEQKNHSFLIDIFKEYTKLNSNTKLFLIGTGELQETIKNKVKEEKLENKVEFLNSRNDVASLYQMMDLFLFPSLYEGLPVTLVETQVAGLKSLVSNHVTKEVKFTNAIEFFDLENHTAKQWAEKIMQMNLQRLDETKEIEKCPYDIQVVTKDLEDWYIDKLEKAKEGKK